VDAAAFDDVLDAAALDDDAGDDDELPPQPAVNKVAAAPTASAAMGVIFTRLLLRGSVARNVRRRYGHRIGTPLELTAVLATASFSWRIPLNAR
jgi:hypothetical protein